MLYKKPDSKSLGASAIDVLTGAGNIWNKDNAERAAMTLACRDTDIIPKAPDAGKTKTINGVPVQVMHNGLYVKKGGYQGSWQAQTIEELKGNHEPQEEKVFYEVMKRVEPGGAMIELGSWWSYYSMWYLRSMGKGTAICCEPDPENIALGKENAALNGFRVGKEIVFYNAASGPEDGELKGFVTEAGAEIDVPVRSVDSVVEERKLDRLDILHLDIQGYEMEALKGALTTIKKGKLRFLFVSTHHYIISGDPLLHFRCLEFIRQNGGHIISRHTILESCSGDGLIVASFDDRDKDFWVSTSLQHTDDSLFRSAEIDSGILWEAYDMLAQQSQEQELRLLDMEQNQAVLEREIDMQKQHVYKLQGQIEEITPLRRHFKRQVKTRLHGIDYRIMQRLESSKAYHADKVTASDIESLEKSDKKNFESYNEVKKGSFVLRQYVRARRTAAKTLEKVLKG